LKLPKVLPKNTIVATFNYNKIKDLAAAKRIPIKELARRCELSEQGFHYMLKKHTMRVDTLERVCATLEITMVDLFTDTPVSTAIGGVSHKSLASSNTELMQKLDTIIDLLKLEKPLIYSPKG
jgi:DNA-binding Xre family transcriptional regulator